MACGLRLSLEHGRSTGSQVAARDLSRETRLLRRQEYVTLGARYYAERAVDGYGAAVRAAAYAQRKTGRPVPLIVWRGAHA